MPVVPKDVKKACSANSVGTDALNLLQQCYCQLPWFYHKPRNIWCFPKALALNPIK